MLDTAELLSSLSSLVYSEQEWTNSWGCFSLGKLKSVLIYSRYSLRSLILPLSISPTPHILMVSVFWRQELITHSIWNVLGHLYLSFSIKRFIFYYFLSFISFSAFFCSSPLRHFSFNSPLFDISSSFIFFVSFSIHFISAKLSWNGSATTLS